MTWGEEPEPQFGSQKAHGNVDAKVSGYMEHKPNFKVNIIYLSKVEAHMYYKPNIVANIAQYPNNSGKWCACAVTIYFIIEIFQNHFIYNTFVPVLSQLFFRHSTRNQGPWRADEPSLAVTGWYPQSASQANGQI